MNVLGKLWRGAYSLPAAFWGFYVLGFFAACALSVAILLLSYALRISTLGFLIGFCLLVCYWFIASAGVWKSAGANIGAPIWMTKVWGFAARSVVVVFAARFLWWLADGGGLYLAHRMTTRLDF